MDEDNYIYGLDDKIKKIIDYCTILIGEESGVAERKKLSIYPTFLFYGLPGTGKTTIANYTYQVLKKDYNIDMKYLRIDELLSYNFGESSKNLRKFFEEIENEVIENNSYAFVVIDELDSFTINRYANDNDSIKRILLTFNTLIDEMVLSGIIHKIIIIATTNMKNSIDTSVLRRFFFHEDFNISLNKIQFFAYIDDLISISHIFKQIDKNCKEELFKIYSSKKFSLGEIKTIFAHIYMDIKTSTNCNEEIRNIFMEKPSFWQIINEQHGGY